MLIKHVLKDELTLRFIKRTKKNEKRFLNIKKKIEIFLILKFNSFFELFLNELNNSLYFFCVCINIVVHFHRNMSF